MPQKALTALVFIVTGLLIIVVVVGLAQRLLDPTGVAVALTSLLAGTVGGTFLRRSSNSGGDKDGGDR